MNLDDKNLNKGATMIEYALIAGLIAIVAIGAMSDLGRIINSKISIVSAELDATKTEDKNSPENNIQEPDPCSDPYYDPCYDPCSV